MIGLLPLPIALAQAALSAPVLLLNTSPSEPLGFYVRVSAEPAVGQVIAFRPPPGAWPYVGAAMPERARTSILKTIRAGEGDAVCAAAQHLAINGRILAAIARTDRRGRPLPQWGGCRQLRRDEYFVFSARIPNSFDSRYYGPVRRTDVIGVYQPLGALVASPGPSRPS
ncbi:S26 family signal peptidase [Caulobacter sp. AP07]|uniref:S26 family signal peptidase n=1 Tax=Caulobacter sp. AP07 TaxID=1144304 RepID=UPI001EE68313|nr:S26 family signal peptidase [Caulobacter sp. AP07]